MNAEKAANKSSCSLLLVDDEPLNLEVLESYLHDTGYRIIKAADGEEALASVAGSPPDLVLLDIMMPGMDGFEVCRRLKSGDDTRFIPVVMVTALDQKSDRIAAIEAGADDFITKPVDKVELLARVRSLIRIKLLHDELEDKYRQVVELQIMKDNLVSMLVHDFRNPLTGVLGYLDLMGCQLEAGKCDDCMQFVHNSSYLTKKMSSMVSDLLDLSRLEKHMLPLQLEKVHLKDVVDENIREFAHGLARARIKTVLNEEAPGVVAYADDTLIKRVVGNILANAISHSPEESTITFGIGAMDGMAVLSISDEGPGIPEEALGRVFEKFYQYEAKVSNTRSGAGLGLAFCDMVVRAHGGDIKVVNNPGRGCTFTINVPAIK